MKRVLALLLAVVLTVSWFTGCAGDTQAERRSKKAAASGSNASKGVYDFDEALSQVLISSVVLRTDTLQAFAKGLVTSVPEAPITTEEATYIPGAFVTEGLGGTVKRTAEDSQWSLQLKGTDWSVNGKSGSVKKGGALVELKHQVAGVDRDFMISTEDYSAVTGMDVVRHNELILVGEGVKEAMEELPDESAQAMCGIMETHLYGTPVSGIPASEASFDRHAVSHISDIDSELVPYKSPDKTLVAVSGSLFVEELEFQEHPVKEDYFICSMVIYNTGLTYGAAESYTADDTLVDRNLVDPYGGRYQSVFSAICNSALMIGETIKWIGTGDMSGVQYRTSGVSSENKISLEVPRDGYVFITDNPKYSKTVAACNAVLYFTQIYVCQTELNPSIEEGNPRLRDLILESVTGALLEDPVKIVQLADMFYRFINSDISVSPMDDGTLLKTFRENFATAATDSLQLLADLLESGVEVAQFGLAELCDIGITEVLSKSPVIGDVFDVVEIIADYERLVGICNALISTQNSVPLIFQPCDWRTAYAKLLRENNFPKTNHHEPRFALCYIDNNSIPELVVMDGAEARGEAYVFSYRNGKILARQEMANAFHGCLVYYEFADIQISGQVHYGVESVIYSRFLDPESGESYRFLMDGNEGEIIYKYNAKEVAKWWYELSLARVQGMYSEFEEITLEYSECYSITEENIRKVIEKK